MGPVSPCHNLSLRWTQCGETGFLSPPVNTSHVQRLLSVSFSRGRLGVTRVGPRRCDQHPKPLLVPFVMKTLHPEEPLPWLFTVSTSASSFSISHQGKHPERSFRHLAAWIKRTSKCFLYVPFGFLLAPVLSRMGESFLLLRQIKYSW